MKAVWLTILMLASVTTAYADRDIVYAARYYAPPGSHRTSHSHIYRINPNGTGRTQLTFGTADDSAPKWSPDGRWIAFMQESVTGNGTLCLIKATGGAVTKMPYDYVSWSPDSRFLAVSAGSGKHSSVEVFDVLTRLPEVRYAGASGLAYSPDGRFVYLTEASGPDVVLNQQTGDAYPVEDALKTPVWLRDTVVGYRVDEKAHTYFLRVMDTHGRELRPVRLKFLRSLPDGIPIDIYPEFDGDVLLPTPEGHTLIYAQNHHLTSGDSWDYFRLNPANGAMQYLSSGAILAWLPDGSRFCTTPRQSTTFYTKRRCPQPAWEKDEPKDLRIMDKYRMVWATPLFIHDVKTGKMTQITPRLSYVAGADWRKEK